MNQSNQSNTEKWTEWRIAETISEMLDASAIVPENTEIETVPYADYLYLTINGYKYKVSVTDLCMADV